MTQVIPKPKKCGENWLEMKSITEGRLCHVCNKRIFDFTNKSWEEIEKIHLSSSQPVCGTYSSKQLEGWSTREETSNWKFVKKALSIIGIIAAIESSGQTKSNRTIKLENVYDSIRHRYLASDTIKWKNIEGEILDEDGEALAGVNVVLKNSKLGTVADADGHFKLSLDETLEGVNLSLIVSMIGYTTVEIPIMLEGQGINKNLKIRMASDENQFTAFYISKPSFWQRVKYRLKQIF